jgi:hypothetical protein
MIWIPPLRRVGGESSGTWRRQGGGEEVNGMVESLELQKLRAELGSVQGENEELKARLEGAERRQEECERNMRDLVRHSVNSKGIRIC